SMISLSSFSNPFSRSISFQIPFSAKAPERYTFSSLSAGASRNILSPSAIKSPSSLLTFDFFNNCCIFFICPFDVLVIIYLPPVLNFRYPGIKKRRTALICRTPFSLLIMLSLCLILCVIVRQRIADFVLIFGNRFLHRQRFVDVYIHILTVSVADYSLRLSFQKYVYCFGSHNRSINTVFTGRCSASLHVSQDCCSGLDSCGSLNTFCHSFRMADTLCINDNVMLFTF